MFFLMLRAGNEVRNDNREDCGVVQYRWKRWLIGYCLNLIERFGSKRFGATFRYPDFLYNNERTYFSYVRFSLNYTIINKLLRHDAD